MILVSIRSRPNEHVLILLRRNWYLWFCLPSRLVHTFTQRRYSLTLDLDGEWIISIIDDKLYLKSPDWDSPSVHRHLLEQTDREDVEKVCLYHYPS
jgi:hypothetical protein